MKLLVWVMLLGWLAGCSSTAVDNDQNVEPETAAVEATADESTETATSDVATADDGDKVICYREQKSGSHFTRKVCKTKRQMQEDRRAARELMDRSRTHDDRVQMEGQ